MPQPSKSSPATSTRWNLVISGETNITVRSFLAQRGTKKGDLSNFVEEAVRWRVFEQTLAQARQGFADLSVVAAEALLEEALNEVRAHGLKSGLYNAFKPNKAPTPSRRGKSLDAKQSPATKRTAAAANASRKN